MPHHVVLIKGDFLRTWRESIWGKNKSLSFRRGRIWNVDDMTKRCVTLFRKSRIDQRLHWCGHLFNYRSKRMYSNKDKRRFTLDKGGKVERGLRWWKHQVYERRSGVRRNQGCLRI
jgi:hypothetical protein